MQWHITLKELVAVRRCIVMFQDDLRGRVVRLWEDNQAVVQIIRNKTRYLVVEDKTRVPWYIVGLIHYMECDLSFAKHLHNGDSLNARTQRAPKGRPLTGSAPFPWETSAADALCYDGLNKITDWSVPRIAYMLEKYNGWGYYLHRKDVPTPYLWSMSNHYSRGKYIEVKRDGVWKSQWEPTLVSAQVGAMAILRKLIDLDPTVQPDEDGIFEEANVIAKAPAVDPEKAAAKAQDLVPMSTTMTFYQRLKVWAGVASITSAGGATLAEQVDEAQGIVGTIKTVFADHALLIVVGTVIVFSVGAMIVAEIMQRRRLKEYREGRWIPSGEAAP